MKTKTNLRVLQDENSRLLKINAQFHQDISSLQRQLRSAEEELSTANGLLERIKELEAALANISGWIERGPALVMGEIATIIFKVRR